MGRRRDEGQRQVGERGEEGREVGGGREGGGGEGEIERESGTSLQASLSLLLMYL